MRKNKIKKIVKLVFPQSLIKQPITFKVATKCNVVPNIRRAKVTDTVGELVLELEGELKNVEKAVRLFKKYGVEVELVEGDFLD